MIDSIQLIGCGGTGSFLASHLARLIKGFGLSFKVDLWDGDRITKSGNILRSPLFTMGDRNQNKALVLADRLNGLYALDAFSAHPFFFRTSQLEPNCRHLFISCTDSMTFRHGLAKKMESGPSKVIWLDVGNGQDYGQAYAGVSPGPYLPSQQWPNFWETFDEPETPTCTEAPFEFQGPLVNDQAALAAMVLLEPLLVHGALTHQACFFSSTRVSSVPVTSEEVVS